ncbi:DNA transposase [Frankliniella fusca]|uniref:DNA transposase n=1 Tax=Frankliniella fusca TaxID=407009 RepID=A0AAE1HV86_9NEOP|nr:DNA transposase [Frankliniella fusca]
MKKPAPQQTARVLSLKKPVGRPPDASRTESSGTSSSDPLLFASLEKVHTLGLDQYISQQDSSCISFMDICKKLVNWNFSPGVLKDNIYAIKQMLNAAHFCTLSVDVFPIEPVIQFDHVSEVFTGFVAPLSSDMKPANEVIVFMIQGFEIEWKCLAGYMLVNIEEDGWAVWHILNQMVVLLAQYDFTVVNVVFGEGCGFELLDNHADENTIRGDSIIQHPYYQRDILCFSKSLDDLVKSVSECILHSNFLLPDEILKKYELTEKALRHEHLQVLLSNNELSSQSITTWLFQRHRDFPEEDKMPELKTEIFVLRMLWMWVNAMTFILHDDSSGFYSVETHVQTLRDTSSIFEELEKDINMKNNELLWNSVRRTTLSALSFYDHYVGKGLISSIKFNSFRCLSIHNLKYLVQCNDLLSEKPMPCNVLQFLHLINLALFFHSNFAAKEFENGAFLSEFLRQRRIYLPIDIEESEDLSDIEGLGLYYLTSRVVTKWLQQNECEKCKAALVADQTNQSIPAVLREAVETKGFIHPSISVYDTLQWAESQFVHTDEDILRFHKPCTQFAFRIYGEMAFGIRNAFPSCHEVLRSILKAFMCTRLKMVAEDLTKRLN